MDIVNQLCSFTLGVEPNKQTLQTLAATLNSAVVSLADKQKLLSDYAETVEGQKFVSAAQQAQPELSQQQIKYIEAAPTPQAAKARKAKVLRDPVVWKITEAQMKELQWKRKQLLQAQKVDLERKKQARAKRPPPPKLGQSKSAQQKKPPTQQSSAQKQHPAKPQAASKASAKPPNRQNPVKR